MELTGGHRLEHQPASDRDRHVRAGAGSLTELAVRAKAPAISLTGRGHPAISFVIGEPGQVAVRVFNRAGRLVSVVTNQRMSAGANLVRWNGKGSSGETVPDGLYIVSIESAGERITKTMSVIR